MSAGNSVAMVLSRVPRGARAPDEETLRRELQSDRERLTLGAPSAPTEVVVRGPYHIQVDGQELDEYVAWER